jgi:dipeptidyl-peptidase-4
VPFDPKKRYPVFVSVYGGPGGPMVKKAWGGSYNHFHEYMAQHGYVVFILDNRGTGYRGTAFDAPIYHQMGAVEVQDQVAGVRFLQTLPYVDPQRVGIFGWSYGGYMTVKCLLQAPEVFKVGAAVAPVTDWKLYDTHYTERYLGTPQQNPEGYEKSSVFPYLDGLKGSLLLIHGMADDNVLFTHTTRLIKALEDRNIPFDMLVYPGSKHSLDGKQIRSHVFSAIARFFDRNLK